MPNNKKYNLVAESTQSTVVGEYVADGVRVAHYQSEADLERAFINNLRRRRTNIYLLHPKLIWY